MYVKQVSISIQGEFVVHILGKSSYQSEEGFTYPLSGLPLAVSNPALNFTQFPG